MQNTLITITIVAFGLLLLTNVFFRIKTFRTFQKLADKGVRFGRQHVFNRSLLEAEILPRYPQEKDLILAHINSMKRSFRISSLCMVVLTICGGVLMYYRNSPN
ncbi:MAG: hypothetical protein AB8E82_02675 [Aureispira sp.]